MKNILLLFALIIPTVAFSESYTIIGKTIYSNDGTSYTKLGNTTYGSDGSSYTRIGDTIYFNPGRSKSGSDKSSNIFDDHDNSLEKGPIAIEHLTMPE